MVINPLPQRIILDLSIKKEFTEDNWIVFQMMSLFLNR